MPKAALHTLGCRLNQAETAIIAQNLKNNGFEVVEFGQKADLTVINTCTVTEQADAKCRQAVRQSIRSNPETYVAVIGCYAQMDVDTIRTIEGVDLIIGNQDKMRLARFLPAELVKENESRVVHSPRISREEFTIDTPGQAESNTRANLKIQDGCSFVCSFCIIAKARGPARSRKFFDIRDEARKLVQAGFKEIVLTGVNIGTYAQDGKTFTDVLDMLEQVPGIGRIRISSIEPTTVTEELIDYIAASSKICRHLHIPLQSGDDEILESMRRKHSSAQFRDIIEYAAEKIPGIGLGTDIMVGYPGENEARFVTTKKLVVDLPLAYFHVFSYSDRQGTASYKMKPKVEHAVKKQRNRILTETGARKKRAFYESFIGSKVQVLFEEKPNGYWEGFSDNYMRVRVKSSGNLKNQMRMVRLTGLQDEQLTGEIL